MHETKKYEQAFNIGFASPKFSLVYKTNVLNVDFKTYSTMPLMSMLHSNNQLISFICKQIKTIFGIEAIPEEVLNVSAEESVHSTTLVFENYFDKVDDIINYPSNVQLLSGVPKNTTYDYVSSSYANGIVNNINAFYAMTFDDQFEPWDDTIKKVKEINNSLYTNLSDLVSRIVIIGEVEDDWYIISRDYACSDCDITRLSKDKICSDRESIIRIVQETAASSENLDPATDKLRFIEIKLIGDITL